MAESSGTLLPSTAPKRSLALDALRGYAILTMVLSGLVPATLPAWMYHAQSPGYNYDASIPGITWVDLVFPFFLFSMGAAFPLALTRRLESMKDKPWHEWLRIGLYVAERGVFLYFFAVFQIHTRLSSLHYEKPWVNCLLALGAFGILCLIFTRLPKEWPSAIGWACRGLGWTAAFVLLGYFRHEGADLTKSNIILLVLANVVVSGSVIWILTRRYPTMRMGFLLLLMGIWLLKDQPGWMGDFWRWTPSIPWGGERLSLSFIYTLNFHKYLFIVIPGTFAGELLLNTFAKDGEQPSTYTWSTLRFASIGGLSLFVIILTVIGLFEQELKNTTIRLVILCLYGFLMVMKPRQTEENRLARMYAWGVFWLFLGLCFEPYEGGIKKDPATTSYFFVCTGLAFFALITLTVLIDILNFRKMASLLVLPGQNPMIAYVGSGHLIMPLLCLTGFETVMSRLLLNFANEYPALGPWAMFGYAVFKMLLLALVVSGFTKWRIFWRT